MSSVIDVKGRSYEVHEFIGDIVKADKTRDTHVSGRPGKPGVTEIRSYTIAQDDIFLIDEDGLEKVLRLAGYDLAVREGHRLRVLSVRRAGEVGWQDVFVQNLAIDSCYWIRDGLGRAVGHNTATEGSILGWLIVLLLFLLLLLVALNWPMLFILPLVMAYLMWRVARGVATRKELQRKLVPIAMGKGSAP